jgi:dipeptidyl aminopeptidase/acylaminoacyl peptidase
MRKTLYFAAAAAAAATACAPTAPAPVSAPQAAEAAPAAPAAAQATRLPYLDRLPPIIDREVFFGDPEITGAQISPDGRFISFRRPLDGVMNVWVKERGQPFDAARPVTADTNRPVMGYFWSQDSRRILYVQDRGGDENFHVYAVDPTAPAAAGSRAPEARNLTPYPGVRAMIYAVPQATPNFIFVGLNDRDPQLHDVYRVDLRDGSRQLVFRNDQNVVGWQFDLQGRLRLGVRMTPAGGTEILRVDGNRLTQIYECSQEESCGPVRFHRDGRRVYMITNRGEPDLTGLVLFDVQTRREELVERDPQGQVDFGGAEFSRATQELVATYYVGDRLRVYPKDARFARDWERLRAALPEGDIYLGSTTRDDRLALVSVTSDVDPGATYLFDRQTGEVEFLYRPRPNLPTEHLAEMRPVRYTARDGVEVPAYLTLPRGVEPRNLAVVVVPHGGPWARDYWGYNPEAQFLANRGYAVLQPNFRGSTGFGKRFLNLGNREWGTGTMQHDITDGVQYLVQQGIADPRRVGIYGGSYGGYATLAGLAFTPELYAAGVSFVGPSSIISLLNSIPPYWAPMRQLFAVRVGDLENPADVEMMRAQSPLYSATNITAPLLVIQGANDPRVVKAESDQIVVALRDLGRTVDYMIAWDEGHGFAGRENRIAMYTGLERFFARHLGGRYQPETPAPIAERLARMMVQIDTLRLATPVAGAAEAATAPLPSFSTGSVRPMTLRYDQTLEMGQQRVQLNTTRTVAAGERNGRAVWIVAEQAQSPMGAAADTVYLDRQTLHPIRRIVRQGPATIEVAVDGRTVTGQIRAGPQEMPIDARLEADVLFDGGSAEVALATLPLAQGYTTTLRTFDLMQQRTKPQTLTVAGSERVEVPAGAFDAWRIELQPTDGSAGSTVWVERAAPHRVVRSTTRLPAQMGGGTATSELAEAQ